MKTIYLPLTLWLFIAATHASAQSTQGFFTVKQPAKAAQIPKAYMPYPIPVTPATVTIAIDYNKELAHVSNYIYGNNANVYMTDMVSEPDLIAHIKNLAPHVLRYPGGNLSNVFFWNAAPGQKPADVPDTILYGDNRKNRPEYFWYGNNQSRNTLSVDKYYAMLQQTNSTGIVCVNYAYARYGTSINPVANAAHYAANWVRYDKGRTKFWEIGNEDYGTWQAGYKIDTTKNKDGQPSLISGLLYGTQFKIFADSMRAAAKETGADIHIGAVLVEAPKIHSWEGSIERNWNGGFFKGAGNAADFFIVHSYFTPYNQNSNATTILNTASTEPAKMMNYMKQLCADGYIDLKPIALTEWNIFAEGSKQQCSYINGMHAAIVLGELATNQYGMASRWNLANGYGNGNDHGMFSKGDEPGVPLWNPRPVFYYMYYFQQFFGDKVIASSVSGSADVVVYASKFNSGETGVVVVNKGTANLVINIQIAHFKPGKRFYLYTLSGGTDNGEFSQKVLVNGQGNHYTAGGPDDVESIKALSGEASKKGISISSAARSVQYILIGKK